MGSLVQLEQAEQAEQEEDKLDRKNFFFIAPAAGGYRCKIKSDQTDINVTVITPQSPMGTALLGKVLDDEVVVSVGINKICNYIVAIE